MPQSAELSQALDSIFGLPLDGSSTGQQLQKANGKMKKLENRPIGEQQAPIEVLNKKLYGERPTPDFSHCWELKDMSPEQLEFLESQKQKAKEKNKKDKKQKKSYHCRKPL